MSPIRFYQVVVSLTIYLNWISVSECLRIPGYLNDCTFHLKTDYAQKDVERHIGRDIFPLEDNSWHPPVIVENTNLSIVKSYQIWEEYGGAMSSTYRSMINYKRVVSRYKICLVGVIFSYWFATEDDASRLVFVAIKQLIDAWQSPNFIFFEDVKLGGEVVKFPVIPHTSTMAVCVVFGSGGEDDGKIVVAVNGDSGYRNDLVGSGISEMTSAREIVSTWRKLNKNLGGKKIYLKMSHRRHRVSYCSIRSARAGTNLYRFAANDCVKSYFLKSYNATISEKRELTSGVFNVIASETLPYEKAKPIMELLQRSLSLEWIKYGVRVESYAFSIFFEGKERIAYANLAAVVLPFGWKTWLCVLASAIGVGIVIFYKRARSVEPADRLAGPNWRWATWIFANLLDQSDVNFLLRGNPKFKGIGYQPVLAVWTVGSLCIGFLYKGSLFSYMTSTHEPVVPKTFEALLDSTIPMITTTYMTPLTSRVPVSPLQNLLDDFVTILDSTATLHNLIEKIRNRTIYIPAYFRMVRIARNISLSQPIETCKNGRMSDCETFDKNEMNIGKKFAILSVKRDIAAFSNYLNEFSRWTEIPNGSPTPVTLQVPWVMFYNFVYDSFSRYMAGLVESGIHSWWERNAHVSSQVWLLGTNRRVRENSKRRFGAGSNIPGLVQRLWVKEMVVRETEGEAGIGRMTIQVVVAPVLICSVLVGLAGLIFYVECNFREYFARRETSMRVVPY
ncbi:hypothetical protein Fcan01_27314 [Folsomia candida]|uniref:Uncharacterized protein n=1 Tax=Folsomia candida TaxID=158441 RepID=A0A226CX42_FOLCA|nr:hypothetical protein Fcan01_27314 [Folsomia candida]